MSQSDNRDGCHQTNDHINTAYSMHKRPYHEADTKAFSPEIGFSFVTWNSLSCSSVRDTNSVNAHLGRVPVLPASLVKARGNQLNRHASTRGKSKTVKSVKSYPMGYSPLSKRHRHDLLQLWHLDNIMVGKNARPKDIGLAILLGLDSIKVWRTLIWHLGSLWSPIRILLEVLLRTLLEDR